MEVTTDQYLHFDTFGLNLNAELSKCINDIIKREGYVTCSVDKHVFTADGSGFLGVLCEVHVEGETSSGNKETDMFMKIIIPNKQLTIFSISDSYKRELFVYTELSKVFTEMQLEAAVPSEERFRMVKSYDESNPNVIILENMNKKDFKTIYRMDTITLKYAVRAIRELAKFHALSFALESQRPIYFEKKIKPIKRVYNLSKDWNGFVDNMCQITLNYLDKESRRKLADYIPSFSEKYPKYLNGEIGRRCLRHGDYRPNNILIKETDGKITEMITIDYQFICYGCPILDIAYFIFSSTDQGFRRAHLPYLKELYYESLGSFLKYFSLDVKKVYSRKDFEDDYREMLDYGLMASINLVPLLMVCENNVPDLTTGPLAGLSLNIDSKCKERMVGIVHDFIAWGYL